MVTLRSQDGEPKDKEIEAGDPTEQRIDRLEEMVDEVKQQHAVILEKLSRLLGNQRSDDQFTLNRDTSPSMKAWRSGSDHFERSRDDRWCSEDDETDSLEEESMPQFQVPVSNSEILKSSELGKVDLGLENEEYVVLNENLEQELVQKKVKTSFEADGAVGKGQKIISDANICCAHKVFVKMPSKEKRIKHLKGWKFKFKPTSKRSRLMDDKFSFVDATVLLNKDPQEIIWDCVKKEFKETMAGCGKTRVDRFKLVHATPRPGDYDRPLQSSVWDSGGSLLECVDEESFGDDKIKEWLFKVEEFFSIDFTPMELKVKLVTNHFDGDTANWHQSQVQTGQFGHLLIDWGAYKIAVNANLGFSDYNNKRMKGTHEKLGCEIKSAGLTRVSVADGNKLGVLWLKKVEPITWEVKKLEMRFMTSKQKVLLHGMKPGSVGEIRTQKLNRIQDDEVQISMLCVQELPRESVAAVFFLDCNSLVTTISLEDQKLQGDREPLLNVPDVAAKICETFDQYIRKKGSVSAARESESNQPTLRLEIILNHYMVLLLTPVAYAIQFLGGVGMDKKLFHLSLRNHRVWDPGG